MPLIQRSDPYPHWLFTASHGDALRLVPERGGLVTGWCCDGREQLYFDAERFADPALSVRGGIPVLFPICGGLPGSRLPQHGFARDAVWSLAALPDDTGVSLSLEDTAASRDLFPHPFRLELQLRLEPQALAITMRLRHRGAAGDPPLPFSFGLHPYLAVTDPAAVRLEGLPEQLLDQVTQQSVARDQALMQLAAGVDLLAGPVQRVRLLDPLAATAISLEVSAPLDLAVVWTDPPRPMVCLEPWTAPRGALASGERLLQVQPGEDAVLACRYRVEPLPCG